MTAALASCTSHGGVCMVHGVTHHADCCCGDCCRLLVLVLCPSCTTCQRQSCTEGTSTWLATAVCAAAQGGGGGGPPAAAAIEAVVKGDGFASSSASYSRVTLQRARLGRTEASGSRTPPDAQHGSCSSVQEGFKL